VSSIPRPGEISKQHASAVPAGTRSALVQARGVGLGELAFSEGDEVPGAGVFDVGVQAEVPAASKVPARPATAERSTIRRPKAGWYVKVFSRISLSPKPKPLFHPRPVESREGLSRG
jgi:hypothetical protein